MVSLNPVCGKIFYKDVYIIMKSIDNVFPSKKVQQANFKETNRVFQMTFLKGLLKRHLVFAMSR